MVSKYSFQESELKGLIIWLHKIHNVLCVMQVVRLDTTRVTILAATCIQYIDAHSVYAAARY